jgi:hypothetical protein
MWSSKDDSYVPIKNHMPLLPDIQYLPKGDRVHSDYTSFLKE